MGATRADAPDTGIDGAQDPARLETETAGMGPIAARSNPGARLATFTVAGDVRRTLARIGFEVAKKPGHAGKRERLEAVYQGPPPRPRAEPLFPRAATPNRDGPVLGRRQPVPNSTSQSANASRGSERRSFFLGLMKWGRSGAVCKNKFYAELDDSGQCHRTKLGVPLNSTASTGAMCSNGGHVFV